MNTKNKLPFDLDRALAGAKITTRDGRPVRGFMRINDDFGWPYRGQVAPGIELSWTEDGYYVEPHSPDCLDLFMVEEQPPVQPPFAIQIWGPGGYVGYVAKRQQGSPQVTTTRSEECAARFHSDGAARCAYHTNHMDHLLGNPDRWKVVTLLR